MPQDEYHPPDSVKQILDVFKAERHTYGESRMTPSLIRERLDKEMTKQTINFALNELVKRGFVSKLDDGLYEFVSEP